MEFTWHGPNNINTRIDLILVSAIWQHSILTAEIESSDLITDSDHNIVITTLDTNDIIRHNKHSASQQLKSDKRIVFNYDKATSANWSDYKDMLDNLLEAADLKNRI